MRPYFNRFITSLTAILLLPTAMFAAESTTAVADKSEFSYNPLLIGLVSLILILLFAIGVVANVLRQLTFVYRDKMRHDRSNKNNIVKTVLLFFALMIPAIHSFAADAAADATEAAAPVSRFIGGIAQDDFYALMSVIVFEIIILIALAYTMRSLLRALKYQPEVEKAPKKKRVPFWDRFNKSVSIEHEKDVMLDHDYDGIHELDNSLPPWWKWGFYISIIFAVIYLYRYQIAHTGPSSHQEYVEEMQQAAAEKAAYLAKAANNIDESNVTYLKDAADIDEGHTLFEKNCAPCHAPDGGGIVGPNLTDDYWLHGGSIKDIFKSIKYGWQDKGMKSWKDDFSPKQIEDLASFIKSLHGTHPASPKPKQGDLYIDQDASSPKTADTTKTAGTGKPLALK